MTHTVPQTWDPYVGLCWDDWIALVRWTPSEMAPSETAPSGTLNHDLDLVVVFVELIVKFAVSRQP